MWGFLQAVEALRSLTACPWETWWRRLRRRAAEAPLPLAGPPLEHAPEPPPPGRTDLPLLGSTEWRVPERWSADPVSGHDFGNGPSARVRARPDVAGADLLRCWVLGRGGELSHAARCAARGDGEAARFVDEWLSAFLAACPPGRGPQWATAMEVALRAVRLLEAAWLLAGEDAPAARRELFDRALRRHESWLRRHSDWRAHRTGNHFLVATAGRFLLAACLAPTPARGREARRGWRLFWREWRRQVLEDGLHFESSVHYHLLVLDAALTVLDRGRRLGLELPEAARRRLVLAVEAVAALMRPDGSLAAVGDSDDGAFLAPEAGALEDARPLLRRAAALLGTSTEPHLRPAWFPLGGLYVLALREPRIVHCTVSGTGRGRAGTGGHAHDDCGSYELWDGRPLVVDRGTGSYTGDPELRERLRSCRSHSLLVADGRTQNPPVPGRPFRRLDRAKPFLTAFDPSGGGAVELGHHAWCRAPGALSVLRRVALDRSGRLEVRDEVRGRGEHELELRVQWAPGLRPEAARKTAEGLVVEVRGEARALAVLSAAGEGLEASEERVEHSPRQGRVEPASCTVLRLKTAVPAALEHVVGAPAETQSP